MVHRAITKHLSVKNEVEVNTDMLAAARGLCGHDSGIACIMGTGSNSCYYDGKALSPMYLLWDSSWETKAAEPAWANCW